jgi:Flp pilus assembly pilin Flp
MTNLYCKVRSLVANRKGQGLVEYGLILAGVAVVAVTIFAYLAKDDGGLVAGFEGLIGNISGALSGAAISAGAITP